MNKLALDNQLCFPMYTASRLISQIYAPILAELKLTYPQYLVMMVLWQNDSLSLTDIGERLMLDSGTLTPLLKKMEVRGLLSRHRDLEDERSLLIRLTKEGKALQRLAEKVPDLMLCKLDALDHSELLQLHKISKKLVIGLSGHLQASGASKKTLKTKDKTELRKEKIEAKNKVTQRNRK